ncbi:MAG: ABC transporter transmembrane domain-containing protein, partial [bacterium]|nr:ABC transporter transmembrane domain-containing protein [bacterium]
MKLKEKIDFKYNLSVYYSILKKYLFIFIVLLFNSFLIEASLSGDKYLFKLVIDKGTDFISGKMVHADFLRYLSVLTVIFLAIVAYRAAAKWLHVHLLVKMEASMILDLKRRFFNHLLFLDYDFHATHKSGTMISRLSRGSRAIENMTDTLVFQFATLIFQVIVVSLSMAYIHWVLALTILAIVLLFIGYSFFIEVVQQSYNMEANKAEDSEKGLISDVFTNIESIKYYGKEDIINSRYDQACRRSRETQVRHWNFFRWWDFGQSLILGLGTLALVYFSVTGLIEKRISLGTLVFIFTLFGNLMGPLFMFV